MYDYGFSNLFPSLALTTMENFTESTSLIPDSTLVLTLYTGYCFIKYIAYNVNYRPSLQKDGLKKLTNLKNY